MLRHVTMIALSACVLFGGACGKDKDKKGKAGAKLRSAGTTTALSLHAGGWSGLELTDAGNLTANSAFNLESFKVPVHRINLVTDLTGTGYKDSSPNFYTCPGKTAEDCYVDLASASDVDNLLKTGGAGEIEVGDTKSYNGAAIEFCPDQSEGKTFNMLVKGTVDLAGTTYYTNAETGLSSTGPAEEAAVPAQCGGQTTYLANTVEFGQDKTVNLVIYVEPAGAVLASNNKTLVNSNCVGEDDLALCASRPSVFVTVGDTKPAIERYLLDVQGTNGSVPWADMLLTMIFDANNAPVGATVQQIYLNVEQARLMHTLQFTFAKIMVKDEAYDLIYGGADATTAWLSGFKRADAEGYKISTLVDSEVTVNARKL